MANRHIQSVLGIYWPYPYSPYQAKQHRIELGDGDTIVLHEDSVANTAEVKSNVLVIHGMAGSYKSTYMCRTAEKLIEAGYRVFRMDMRGSGAGEGLAKIPTHCACSGDVVAALHHIAELYPQTETSIVAYSMSGTITMNMLAEAGNMRVGNLDRSFVICSPIDLVHVERHFHTFWGRPYNRFFVKLIWSQILKLWEAFPELAPKEIPQRPKWLREIDEMVIAPSAGYQSAEDYYLKASVGSKLSSIKQPLTILYAQDDPIVPIEPLLNAKLSSSVELVTVPHGGHLGFMASKNGDPDFRWLDWRILDWLEAGRHQKASQVKQESVVPSLPAQ